jgi:hypothetical protein
MAGGLRTYFPTRPSLCATPPAASPLATLRRRSRACRCPGAESTGPPRAPAARLPAGSLAAPFVPGPPYMTSALCRRVAVQPQLAPAASDQGRWRPGRSGESFLTGVSVVEMRPGALPCSDRPALARIRFPRARPAPRARSCRRPPRSRPQWRCCRPRRRRLPPRSAALHPSAPPSPAAAVRRRRRPPRRHLPPAVACRGAIADRSGLTSPGSQDHSESG